jgi:integrase/recombinase XerD
MAAARLSLRFEDWPASDQAMWRAAIAEGDILDGAGPGAHWAGATRNNTRKAYGYWLGWLAKHGFLDADVAPLDRVTPERVAAYVTDLQARVAASSVFAYILDLLRYVKRVAPERDWAWLSNIKNRLWARASPAKDKTSRIRPAAELFALGIELMHSATGFRSRYNRLAAEIRFRDGLIIALLAARPIRLKNLTALEIGRHLVCIDGVYWLRLEAEEVKNAKHIEVSLPEALTPWLERYLASVRPRLLGAATSNRLWVSCQGTPLFDGVIRHHVCKHTKAAFGVAISPHLFRDCAATSVAIEDPEHVRIAASILGHHSLATTQRYYDQSRMLDAGRHYQAALTALRDTIDETGSV